MKEDKRRRLEAAGWKVGSAAEFLALHDDEAAVIELKLDLADAVRTRRRLTPKQLAKALRSSQSRVTEMEAGGPSVRKGDCGQKRGLSPFLFCARKRD